MTRQTFTQQAFDEALSAWLDERAGGPAADWVVDLALARTTSLRPAPRWRLLERWIPADLGSSFALLRPVAFVVLIASLLLAAIAWVVVGSPPRLPPPFGLAADGRIAYVVDGHIALADVGRSDSEVITSGSFTQSVPVFSRDGTRIAYIEESSSADPGRSPPACLVIAKIDGTAPVPIESNCDAMSPPAWSPDGRFVVYSRAVAGSIEQLFVAATDGATPPRRIGDPSMHSWGPGWSPDGHTISFVGTDPVTQREQIYLIDADGSPMREVTHRDWSHIQGADQWRPDGRSLVISAGSGRAGYSLWTVEPDGASEELVDLHRDSEVGAVWSPDGSRIAYLDRASGPARIHVFTPADGSDRVLDGSYRVAPMGWAPDGRSLFITDVTNGRVAVAVLDADGSARPQRIEAGPALGTSLTDPPPASWQRLAP